MTHYQQLGGEGSRTPVIPNLVQGPPRMSENGLNTGSADFMEVGGFAWMLPLMLPARLA